MMMEMSIESELNESDCVKVNGGEKNNIGIDVNSDKIYNDEMEWNTGNSVNIEEEEENTASGLWGSPSAYLGQALRNEVSQAIL